MAQSKTNDIFWFETTKVKLNINSKMTCSGFRTSFDNLLQFWCQRGQCHVKCWILEFCPKGPPRRRDGGECFAPLVNIYFLLRSCAVILSKWCLKKPWDHELHRKLNSKGPLKITKHNCNQTFAKRLWDSILRIWSLKIILKWWIVPPGIDFLMFPRIWKD